MMASLNRLGLFTHWTTSAMPNLRRSSTWAAIIFRRLPQSSKQLRTRMNRISKADPGHNAGTPAVGGRMTNGPKGNALAWEAVALIHPRLLDLHDTARYLGVSEWTARDLEAAGVLSRVRVPLA